MTAFNGLLFPSSFDMRSLGGSATAYGDDEFGEISVRKQRHPLTT
jgi:hypothetical protein